MILKHIRLLLIAILIGGIGPLSVFAHKDHEHLITHEDHKKVDAEAFDAGKMIIEHVVDSYEWHILNWGEKHISVYLPVIIFHEGQMFTFMSSAFHHGHSPVFFDKDGQMIHSNGDHDADFKPAFGLAIMHKGPNKGKIAYIKTNEYTDHHRIVQDTEAGLPLDFSITKNVVAMWFSIILMIWIFASVAKAYKTRKGLAPKGAQSVFEPLIVFIRDDIAKSSIGEKKYEKYVPFLLTIFFFIFFNNLLGLVPIIPGGANLTGNIAVTGVLAVFTFIITTFSANKNYWVHIYNTPGVPWWLKFPVPLMPIVELMGVFTKPFVLMVRLFANITAGHIIVLGFISLIFIFGAMSPVAGYGVSIVSVAFSLFMLLLEFLVAFIQAYVFTLLSALYFGAAVEEHH
jgi:F-type H+-transporting ATPase subunit a